MRGGAIVHFASGQFCHVHRIKPFCLPELSNEQVLCKVTVNRGNTAFDQVKMVKGTIITDCQPS